MSPFSPPEQIVSFRWSAMMLLVTLHFDISNFSQFSEFFRITLRCEFCNFPKTKKTAAFYMFFCLSRLINMKG